MDRPNLFSLFLIGAVVSGNSSALAHGAKITSQTVTAIAIQAQYDSGQAMAQAQVLVYPPDDPKEPWLTGVTDAQGKFLFTPDGDRPGNWEIMVRQAGHGTMVTVAIPSEQEIEKEILTKSKPDKRGNTGNIDFNATNSANLATTDLAPTQKWLSIGAVLWGFIGTALFFSQPKPKSEE